MAVFALMAVVMILSSTYSEYVTSILLIRWRTSLTRSLQERWLLSRAFCLQHFPPLEGVPALDNPDQRLQQDIDGFVTNALGVFFGILGSVGSLVVFTPLLFKQSPPYAFGVFYCPGWLLYFTAFYSLLGSCISHGLGKYLVPLSYLREQTEADYRHAAVQVRDHTESVAMYHSEMVEHMRLTAVFSRIQRVAWEKMRFDKHLNFFRNFFYLANDVVPFCVLAANYFKGQISLGELMQILNTLGRIQDALNNFIDSYPQITAARATTDRLWGFWQAVDIGAAKIKTITVAREPTSVDGTASLWWSCPVAGCCGTTPTSSCSPASASCCWVGTVAGRVSSSGRWARRGPRLAPYSCARTRASSTCCSCRRSRSCRRAPSTAPCRIPRSLTSIPMTRSGRRCGPQVCGRWRTCR